MISGKLRKPAFRRLGVIFILGCLIALSVGMMVPDRDFFFKVNKSIEVFGRVYKEIATNYVDQLDPERFMQAGIDGMLGALDPYTVYIEKEETDEVDLLTNGKYGGIGITIGYRDGMIQVITVMDGYSAQRQGVLPGDRIIEVNGVPVSTRKPNEVRDVTRGEPGTEVKVLIEREGEPKPILFVLIREEIQIRNVTYTELREDGIAYIRLERFSRKAGDELRQAIKELQLKGSIDGVVLDLRGNPGGLLDAAVEVVSKFVPRGSLVVSTRGRRPEAEKKYFSTDEPLLGHVPLVVLTDRNSASASEIVAGAVQDLDRGLVVGTRTFGKGLVQTILPLNYGAQLKITTARYYIPSGRSIQEIDYIHRDKNNVFTTLPDSLKREYRTQGGRKVYEHGGITPDSLIQPAERDAIIRELYRKSYFFRFVNKFLAQNKNTPPTEVTDQMLASFRKYLDDQKFDFQEESEGKLEELRQIAVRSDYGRKVLDDLELLSADLAKEKARAFDRYRHRISRELNIELRARLHGEHGRIAASLKDDVQLQTALVLLHDRKAFEKMLRP